MKIWLSALTLGAILTLGGCTAPVQPPATLTFDPPPAQPCVPQHHYKFQQNGAEILRMDSDTGEVCQVAANKLNGWRFAVCNQ